MMFKIPILSNFKILIDDSKKYALFNSFPFVSIAVKLQHNVSRVCGDIRWRIANSPVTMCRISRIHLQH